MRMLINGAEGNDNPYIVGADTTWYVQFLNDNGSPLGISGISPFTYQWVEIFSGATRDTALVRTIPVTVTNGTAGQGTIKLPDTDVSVLPRQQYTVWGVVDTSQPNTTNGSLVSTGTVVTPGAGYTLTPTVSLVSNPGDSGAGPAVAVTIRGPVVYAIPAASGFGYSSATVSITGAPPVGAALPTGSCTVDPSTGKVTAVTMTNTSSQGIGFDPSADLTGLTFTFSAPNGCTACSFSLTSSGPSVMPTFSSLSSAGKGYTSTTPAVASNSYVSGSLSMLTNTIAGVSITLVLNPDGSVGSITLGGTPSSAWPASGTSVTVTMATPGGTQATLASPTSSNVLVNGSLFSVAVTGSVTTVYKSPPQVSIPTPQAANCALIPGVTQVPAVATVQLTKGNASISTTPSSMTVR